MTPSLKPLNTSSYSKGSLTSIIYNAPYFFPGSLSCFFFQPHSCSIWHLDSSGSDDVSEHLCNARHAPDALPSILHILTHLIFIEILRGKNYHYTHFTLLLDQSLPFGEGKNDSPSKMDKKKSLNAHRWHRENISLI